MVKFYIKQIAGQGDNLVNNTYRKLAQLINPETNIVEVRGRPMTFDELKMLLSFSSPQHFAFVTRRLRDEGVLLIANVGSEKYFVINPKHARANKEMTPAQEWIARIIEHALMQKQKEINKIRRALDGIYE